MPREAAKEFDVFICHASEDKLEAATPIAEALRAKNYEVWYDQFVLTLGDSLRQKIDEGLARSRFGVVILSASFFEKDWPRKELDGLAAKEIGGVKVILPVWHRIGVEEITSPSPMLAGRLAVSTSRGIAVVVDEIVKAIGSPRCNERAPDRTSSTPALPGKVSSVENLRALRDGAVRLGGLEHVADDVTVPITAYPSLLEVLVYPATKPPTTRAISLAPGQSVDLRFKDTVVGVGFYYKQGLYPSNFNIYYHDGSQKVVAGKGYYPETEFFGELSANPIDRIIVQTQAAGTFTLTGVYVFAKKKHARLLGESSKR
jgi:hypothetical protein